MEKQYIVYVRGTFGDRKKVGRGHFPNVDEALVQAIQYKSSHLNCKVYIVERKFISEHEIVERDVSQF